MNYFNYFSEIEDAFIRRRGKHVFLSPLDWALIEGWKERGVPLHIALCGIEKSFDSYQSRPRTRSIKTLFYCQEEVEAQFEEWLASQIGANDEERAEDGTGAENDSRLPFPREIIIDYLQRACDDLDQASKKITTLNGFTETLERVAARLSDLKDDFARTARPNAETLEGSLAVLEKLLNEDLFASLTDDELKKERAMCEAQLKDYRSKMDRNVYEQTIETLLHKRLKERYGLPKLSLFYL